MNFLTSAFASLFGAFGQEQTVEPTLREFLSQSELRVLLQKAAAAPEDFMTAETLLIFDTRTQHTWLVATQKALYCVIDNRREPHAKTVWRIARSDLEQDGRMLLPIAESALTPRDFYLVVGKQRPRRISKQLFTTLSVTESVENMLRNAFRSSVPMTA